MTSTLATCRREMLSLLPSEMLSSTDGTCALLELVAADARGTGDLGTVVVVCGVDGLVVLIEGALFLARCEDTSSSDTDTASRKKNEEIRGK